MDSSMFVRKCSKSHIRRERIAVLDQSDEPDQVAAAVAQSRVPGQRSSVGSPACDLAPSPPPCERRHPGSPPDRQLSLQPNVRNVCYPKLIDPSQPHSTG